MLREGQFCISFIQLELREYTDYVKVGESRCRILNKICEPRRVASLRGAEEEACQRSVNLDAQKQWTGLAYGKDTSFIGLGCDYPP